jgi:HD-GYP domain-containing protein (c-di-GMP phosphodiesterase class II)
MPIPIIPTAVYNLDKKIIAEAGQALTFDFLHKLVKDRPKIEVPKTFADYPEILDGLQEPYNKIFDETTICQTTADNLSRAHLYPLVLHALEYFRENDPYTYRHSLMVALLATRMANDFRTIYSFALSVASVVPSHDIGKINIPLSLLTKSEELSVEEIMNLRCHACYGFILLSYYIGDADPLSCQIAYEHHEFMNGRGYPREINESNELVELVTVCDMFDALVSPRPYRQEQYTPRAAIELICDAAGAGKVNWDCVKLLISYNRADKPPIEKVVVSQERRGKEPKNNKYSMARLKPESQTF